MKQLQSKSAVVGIDGSQAAVNAAKWAVDEAISRQIPVRLVSMSSDAKRRNPRRKTFPIGNWSVAKRRLPRQTSPCKT